VNNVIPFPFERTKVYKALVAKGNLQPSSLDDLPLITNERIEEFHRELDRMLGIYPGDCS
jgi:hypothetical protein